MGRGRAKAKQTKVARKLKYQSIDTDLESLQRELSGDAEEHDGGEDSTEDYESYDPDLDDTDYR